MASKEDDYTKYRTVGLIPHTVNDTIGRHDPTYITAVTVSGTGAPGVLLKD